MNKTLIILVSVLSLGACAPRDHRHHSSDTVAENTTVEEPSAGQDNRRQAPEIPESKEIVWKSVNRDNGDIAIVKDTVTGCEYIELDDKTMYPRLNASGQPMCGQTAN